VTSVSFLNVPSYVLALDEIISIPGYGNIRYDLAFGGAFYAYIEAADIGLSCKPKDIESLIKLGRIIKREISGVTDLRHPFEEDMNLLYGTIFTSPPANANSHSRNVCIFADGEVDRSPTGTGVSGRMAIRYARNQSRIDEPFIVESVLGSTFTGKVIKETTFGPHKAVISEISGRAHIIGRQEFFINPDDPLKTGFIFR
jgi:trans-L-3-hydroxyproline dehydratase